MNNNPFYRLAPFIQEYIYNNGWTELRAVQVEACRVLFNTSNHLLLSSGTASGKTEAAFLPALTLLQETPSVTIGILYIAPIKALINDQFERLNDLLKEANIPVWHWHGDVSQTHKSRLMKNPSGILQITPESLESMLMNKNRELVRLFGDLKFIIIDEVHCFMGTDRGNQILCQLERLSRYIHTTPRRIGLSATLGDYTLAEEWLSAGTKIPTITPKVSAGNQKIRLAVENFYKPIIPDVETSTASEKTPKSSPFWEYVFEKTLNRKCIIFANFREWTEAAIATLRQLAELRGLPDIYHVHHGSISAALRETAESHMKASEGPVVIAATVTLEMGIDIGQLERIVQLDPPFAVSSFLQRLGRSGRRGNASEMFFVCEEERATGMDPLPYHIPWRLMQCIAIIQLYLEEKWIEPPRKRKYPLSLLYHQTMSILYSMGEMTPSALAERVLTLSTFKDIPQEDFKELLYHLIEIGHIETSEERGLIVGLEGEKIVGAFQFFAVFSDEEEFTVLEDSHEIGRIEIPPPFGERLTLAGRTWEVIDIDIKRRIVYVKRIKGKLRTYWHGDGASIHTKVLQRMKRILIEDMKYPYLQPNAMQRIGEVKILTETTGIGNINVFGLGGNHYCIFPWMGTADYHTLKKCIQYYCTESLDIKSIGGSAPYFIIIKMEKGDSKDLLNAIHSFCSEEINTEAMVNDKEVKELKKYYEYKTPKYDKYIPLKLLRKALLTDYMDTDNIKKLVQNWKYTQ